MSTVTLTGAALKAEASRLAIPGRSKMSADELRAAVAATLDTLSKAATDPAADLDDWAGAMADRSMSDRGATVPSQRPTLSDQVARFLADNPNASFPDAVTKAHGEALTMNTPTAPTPATFAARWGKRKPSRTRIHRRSL